MTRDLRYRSYRHQAAAERVELRRSAGTNRSAELREEFDLAIAQNIGNLHSGLPHDFDTRPGLASRVTRFEQLRAALESESTTHARLSNELAALDAAAMDELANSLTSAPEGAPPADPPAEKSAKTSEADKAAPKRPASSEADKAAPKRPASKTPAADKAGAKRAEIEACQSRIIGLHHAATNVYTETAEFYTEHERDAWLRDLDVELADVRSRLKTRLQDAITDAVLLRETLQTANSVQATSVKRGRQSGSHVPLIEVSEIVQGHKRQVLAEPVLTFVLNWVESATADYESGVTRSPSTGHPRRQSGEPV